jgi:hypothetical protein
MVRNGHGLAFMLGALTWTKFAVARLLAVPAVATRHQLGREGTRRAALERDLADVRGALIRAEKMLAARVDAMPEVLVQLRLDQRVIDAARRYHASLPPHIRAEIDARTEGEAFDYLVEAMGRLPTETRERAGRSANFLVDLVEGEPVPRLRLVRPACGAPRPVPPPRRSRRHPPTSAAAGGHP